MVSRKITIDNCVRFVRKREQTRKSNPNVIKKSLPLKQNEQTTHFIISIPPLI